MKAPLVARSIVILVLCAGFIAADTPTAAAHSSQNDESPPSTPEVRDAVARLHETDEEHAAATKDLQRWGKSALAPLRELALARQDPFLEHKLVLAIGRVGGTGGVALLVDILDGRMQVGPLHALTHINSWAITDRNRSLLVKEERFRPAAFAFAESESALEQGKFARIAGWMGWVDAEPHLRRMAKYGDQRLRGLATEALAKLTGTEISVARAKRSFPATRLVPGLLGEPRKLTATRHARFRRASFTKWFDGEDVLVSDSRRSLSAVGPDLEPVGTVELESAPYSCLALPHRRGMWQVVALLSKGRSTGADYAVAVDRDGRELWSHRPKKSGLADAVPIFGKRRVTGIAFAGATGVVARDLKGKLLWSLEGLPQASGGLSTHPKLPGSLLRFQARVQMLRVDGKRVVEEKWPRFESIGVFHAVLFPGKRNAECAIVAGRGEHKIPRIARIDGVEGGRWIATLPGQVTGLVMLEPERKRRLFCATTRGGELFVVDDEGSLRASMPLPGSDESEVSAYALDAGAFEDGTLAVWMRLSSGTFLVTLDLEGLERSK